MVHRPCGYPLKERPLKECPLSELLGCLRSQISMDADLTDFSSLISGSAVLNRHLVMLVRIQPRAQIAVAAYVSVPHFSTKRVQSNANSLCPILLERTTNGLHFQQYYAQCMLSYITAIVDCMLSYITAIVDLWLNTLQDN